jgi:uncharacterized protein (DUF58 family)
MSSTSVLARIRSRRPLWAVYPTRRLATLVFAAGALWLIPGRVGAVLAGTATAAIGVALVVRLHEAPSAVETSDRTIDSESIGLGDVVELRYTMRTAWPWPVRVELFDDVPPGIGAEIPETPFVLAAETEQTIAVDAEGLTRGRYRFDDVALRVHTPVGLLMRLVRVSLGNEVVVVPSLTNVRRFRLLSMQRRLNDAGVRALKQRGEGTSLSGLRNYVPGDDPRLVDWKATARHQRLISREQTIERSQTVISLIDCGRAMTQLAGRFSRFEHVLSAALVLSDVAASSGDRVGLIAFDETVRAYVPPQRGTAALRMLRTALSGLDATLTEPDYASAFRMLATRQRRRALVLFFTDVIDERAARRVHRLRGSRRKLRRGHRRATNDALLAAARPTSVRIACALQERGRGRAHSRTGRGACANATRWHRGARRVTDANGGVGRQSLPRDQGARSAVANVSASPPRARSAPSVRVVCTRLTRR